MKRKYQLKNIITGETTETIEVHTLAAAQAYFDVIHGNKVLNWMLFEIK
jgi:hypothetical protein